MSSQSSRSPDETVDKSDASPRPSLPADDSDRSVAPSDPGAFSLNPSGKDETRGPGDAANQRTDDLTEKVNEALRRAGQTSLSSSRESQEAEPADTPETPITQPKEQLHSRSLRSKLVLALALMLGVVVGIDEIVRQTVIAPEFANLERVAAFKDTNRVFSAINMEVEFMAETAVHDVSDFGAIWLHALRTEHVEPASESGHSDDQTSTVILHGQVMNGKAERIEKSWIVRSENDRWAWFDACRSLMPDNDVSPVLHRSNHHLWEVDQRLDLFNGQNSESLRGITRCNDGELYLFAAIPLIASQVGPETLVRTETLARTETQPEAFYVACRRLGSSLLANLERRTSVRFSLLSIEGNEKTQKTVKIGPKNSQYLFVRSPLLSPSGKPLAQLNVQLPRDVTNRSNRTTAFARYLSLCGACASLLLLLLMLQRLIIGRLEQIREHTENIAQLGIISETSILPKLQVAGHDEIGQLAKSFDRMRTRLSDAQLRLSEASHAAGMSLVADTVIHNVGNVLTNINSLIETATHRVDNLRIEPLEKLAGRLRSDESDEALHRATPGYLKRLSETLEDDKDELAELLHTLHDNIQHIHQVIRDQRRHAHQPLERADLDLRSVIAEAIKYSEAKIHQSGTRVFFECEFTAAVRTDRSLVIQVLINIITNAANAAAEFPEHPATLNIDVIRTKSAYHVRFRDNGCGMDGPTLDHAFDAHYTTRETGSGLGLHFCAIAMNRIGGSIRAESDGPGQGATFIVEFPIQAEFADDSGEPDARPQTALNPRSARSADADAREEAQP